MDESKSQKADRNALIVFPLLILVGFFIAMIGSQAGSRIAGLPVLALLVGLAFLIQWLVFIPSFWRQTEQFFDLTGSLTYIIISTLAVLLSAGVDGRAMLVWALVMIWAIRLGSFLFRRIRQSGKDDRFDQIKPSFFRFLNAWTVQALWVIFTLLTALITITATNRKGLDVFALIGFVVWCCGFCIEVVADGQKSRFNADPDHKGQFIHSGLWSRSRHPNYFGEIVLWIGVMIIALPVLRGWQWVALVSPVFVILLLTRVSGIPLLEKKADRKWGGQADYEAYKKHTPVLIPKLSSGKRRDHSV